MSDGRGNKKRNYIYLAGNISKNPETYAWREKFVKAFENDNRVVVVNPCANGFNQMMRNTITSDGIDFIKKVVEKSQHLLRSKDKQLISMCNLMIVDLVIGTEEKPLIGTIQELTWADDIFGIPVIGITHNVINPYTTHPWIDENCKAKVDTLDEAIEITKTFFLEY
jgi:hypothetical protein